MVNTYHLKQLINSFVVSSRSSSPVPSKPCTVEELNRLVDNLAALLRAFADEMGKK